MFIKSRLAYLLIMPVLIIMVLVVLFPVLDTVRLSFFDVSFIKPGLKTPFIGLNNYIKILKGSQYWRSSLITIKWTLSSIVFQFALGFGLALLVNSKIRGRIVIRSLFLIPWMIPGALAAIMWKWMYHGSIGLINYILLKVGIIENSIPWLSTSSALWPAVLVNVWRGSPFFMVILLAGLQTIPKEIYEAAKIDGAGHFKQFTKITIPLMKPIIITLLIFGTVQAFNFLDIVMVLTGGGPANHTLLLPLYAWRLAFFDIQIGYSATVSILMSIFLIIFGLSIFIIKFVRKNESI